VCMVCTRVRHMCASLRRCVWDITRSVVMVLAMPTGRDVPKSIVCLSCSSGWVCVCVCVWMCVCGCV